MLKISENKKIHMSMKQTHTKFSSNKKWFVKVDCMGTQVQQNAGTP